MNKNLTFCINQILIDDKPVKAKDFDMVTDDLEHEYINHSSGEKEVLSIKKFIKTENYNFIQIFIEEGDKFPYPPKVVDVKKMEEVDNPRSPDEIELNAQLFVLIDVNSSRVFISNQRKKTEFAEWIAKKIGKSVIIKPLIPEDNFIDTIKSIDEINFTVERNLLNFNGSSLSAELARDILGFGAQEATLKLIYKKDKSISEKIKEKIKGIIENKAQFRNITIIGRTSKEFETVFNIEEIINRVIISVTVNPETQKLDPQEVFAVLTLKIRSNE